MDVLLFQLQAPLSSWGEEALGERRRSAEYPGQSALIGLLGASMGLRREEDDAHAALRDGYAFAVGIQKAGTLLRDYHTAQVPGRAQLKGRPHATRRDELAMPKSELNTILSTRDYREDAASLIALVPLAGAPYPLTTLEQALREPRFVLYLGRKSCPLAAPLHPRIMAAESVLAALEDYQAGLNALHAKHRDKRGRQLLPNVARMTRLVWDKAIPDAGVKADLSITRNDRLIRRRGWLFGERIEHIALLDRGEE